MKNKGTFWLKSKVGRTFVCNGRHLEPGGYHWRLTIPNRNFRYDLLIRKRLWEGWCGSSSCWGGRVSGGACLVHAHYVLEILLQISKRTPKKIETCFIFILIKNLKMTSNCLKVSLISYCNLFQYSYE